MVECAPRPKSLLALRRRLSEVAPVQAALAADLREQLLELLDGEICVSGHSLRVGAAQDLLIKGYDLAAIMRAGGWSDPSTVSRYLRFSQHNIWK